MLIAIENTIAWYGHNPCFSRILFAIEEFIINDIVDAMVTILVLVEYSLQYQ